MARTAKNQPAMTYKIAMAASRDAGNKSMKAAGRSVWDEDDHGAACAEFERLSAFICA
jgi:hypothetical protein